jgi:hypothetical protein
MDELMSLQTESPVRVLVNELDTPVGRSPV